MSLQPITLSLPQSIYKRLQQRAEQSRRSVEMELLDVVATAMPEGEELPSESTSVIEDLKLLDDQALWRAARSHLDRHASKQMEALHIKRQSEGLNQAEAQTLDELVRHYERAMLVSAQAASLLKERGHDVSILLKTK